MITKQPLATPAKVMAFFSNAEAAEAVFTYNTAKEIMQGRGLVPADPRRHRSKKDAADSNVVELKEPASA